MRTPPPSRKAPLTPGLRKLIANVRAQRGRETALADRTQIPQQSVNAYLNRIARPPEDRVVLMCDAAGLAYVETEWRTATELAARKRVRRAA
jgi:hypothetical protein